MSVASPSRPTLHQYHSAPHQGLNKLKVARSSFSAGTTSKPTTGSAESLQAPSVTNVPSLSPSGSSAMSSSLSSDNSPFEDDLTPTASRVGVPTSSILVTPKPGMEIGAGKPAYASRVVSEQHAASRAAIASGTVPPDSPESTVSALTVSNGYSSPKIKFGNCPERPPELRRRNSITLGVLARKNMLQAQGSYSGGAPLTGTGHSNVNRLYMTDAEWEEYQQKFAQKNAAKTVDLGDVVGKSAKKLWGKMRRSSSSSVASSEGNRGRSDSAASSTTGSAPVTPVSLRPVEVHHTIAEEEEPVSTPASPVSKDTAALGLSLGAAGAPQSPPQATIKKEPDEEDDVFVDDGPQVEAGRHSPTPRHNARHRGETADEAEYRINHSHTVQALGFELGDYEGRQPITESSIGGSPRSRSNSVSLGELGHAADIKRQLQMSNAHEAVSNSDDTNAAPDSTSVTQNNTAANTADLHELHLKKQRSREAHERAQMHRNQQHHQAQKRRDEQALARTTSNSSRTSQTSAAKSPSATLAYQLPKLTF